MEVRINGELVSVVDEDCEFRSCFRRGEDKGSFTPGVGYTRYHSGGPRIVCFTRHLNGCPHKPAEEGTLREDGTVLLALRDPEPCCENPNVAKNPKAWTQRCRSCGTRLKGKRLEFARARS